MTAPTLTPDVVAFVAAVRAHLDDLDPVEVEELTGGLAADLTDAAADHDGPLEPRFGPPQAYADELRAAAGLPPRGSRRREPPVARLRRELDELAAPLRAHPSWPAVAGFVQTLRPAWWVMRAVVAAWLLTRATGTLGVVLVPLTLALVVVSVELGRGRWSGRRGTAALVLAGDVLAALLVLPMLASLSDGGGGDVTYGSVSDTGQPGLSRDGQPVTNVFAYDAQGRPLLDVQLYDQGGRPLAVDPAAATTWDETRGTVIPVPARDVYGRPLYNVYPLAQRAEGLVADGSATPVPGATTLPAPPLAAVAPLTPAPGGALAPSTATDPAGQPTVPPGAGASVTSSPSAAASPTGSSSPGAVSTDPPSPSAAASPTATPSPTAVAPTSPPTGSAPRPSTTP